MTRNGIITQLYSALVEPRPFSRFTSELLEIEANNEWWKRAETWAEVHVDKNGHYIQ